MGLVQRVVPVTRHNDPFIDAYVVIASILPLVFLPAISLTFVRCLAFAIGSWRTFEVIVFLANSYLFDAYRARMRGEKPRPFGGILRLLILTSINYGGLILWFAVFYRVLIPELSLPGIQAAVDAVNFSFVVMSAFGVSNIQVPNWWTTLLTLFQSAIGLFMALAVVARSVSLIPTRDTGDPFEQPNDKRDSA